MIISKVHLKGTLTISLILFYGCIITGQISFKQYTNDAFGFSILAPCEMKDGQKKLLTDIGSVLQTTFLCQGGDDDANYLYMVSIITYPDSIFVPPYDTIHQDLIKESLDVLTHDLNGQVIYEVMEVGKGGWPTLLFRVSYNQGKSICKGKFILTPTHFFAVQVYTLVEKSLNFEMDKFLNSFDLTHF